MTRDEAVNKFHETSYPASWMETGSVQHSHDRLWAQRAIDGFVALGILKLDEPKKHNKAFCRAYNTLDEEGHHAAQILSLLDEAGLKIVEK